MSKGLLKHVLFFALVVSPFGAGATEILPIDFDLAKFKGTGKLYGQTITVDTRDTAACTSVRDRLGVGKHFADLCARSDDRPFATVVTLRESPFSETQDAYSRTIKKFGPKAATHANNARNVVILGAVGIGRYLVQGLPPTWANVNRHSIDERWKDNVSRGPVIDKDPPSVNFIEHPIAGSIYYTIARHSGFSALESFGFAAFSSTFIWEYGYEAIYEPPSIQDLIITPVLGSVLGEVFYQIDRSIEENDGRVLGSPVVGRALQLITNPGHYLSNGIDAVIGEGSFEEVSLQWTTMRTGGETAPTPTFAHPSSTALALQLRLKFR